MAQRSAALRAVPRSVTEPIPADASAEVAEAVAQERERIRNWLHDTTLQTLEYVAGGGYSQDANAIELMQVAARGAHELRSSIERLGEEQGDDLVSGLRAVVSDAQLFASHSIDLVAAHTDASVSSSDGAAVVDAVREALTNARKHAGAGRVVVFCEEDRGRALVTVKDDGVGFEPHRLDKQLGIRHSIVERMSARGGRALVESRPGEGTLVTLTLGTYLGLGA
ncbi:MAG: ATP-binding protein [Thermoleophilaceae bacterium]|jgi:signal transduction histidine kinase|nr:ATP-binding protein [Thermoleophilaceae bacterium]